MGEKVTRTNNPKGLNLLHAHNHTVVGVIEGLNPKNSQRRTLMKKLIIGTLALILALAGVFTLAGAYESLGFGKTILLALTLALVEYAMLKYATTD